MVKLTPKYSSTFVSPVKSVHITGRLGNICWGAYDKAMETARVPREASRMFCSGHTQHNPTTKYVIHTRHCGRLLLLIPGSSLCPSPHFSFPTLASTSYDFFVNILLVPP